MSIGVTELLKLMQWNDHMVMIRTLEIADGLVLEHPGAPRAQELMSLEEE